MTIQSRTTLKSTFENGDRPQGSNYADTFDSFLHLTDTTAQSISSPITVTTLGATTVSAATVSANDVNGSAASFTKIEAATVSAQRVNGSAATFLGTVSAATVHLGQLIVNADATAAVSAAASAARYVQVRVSGVNYWMPLFAQ